ncbi:Histone acetyltransferases subunit 3 [Trinorchestia longiramus]|nr:Histone acetyltransferases subunit 3 [Trinorchestia longiramus]
MAPTLSKGKVHKSSGKTMRKKEHESSNRLTSGNGSHSSNGGGNNGSSGNSKKDDNGSGSSTALVELKECALTLPVMAAVDHNKFLPRYTNLCSGETISMEELDNLQLELELLASSMLVRQSSLTEQVSIIEQMEKGKIVPRVHTSPGKRVRTDIDSGQRPSKKAKEGGSSSGSSSGTKARDSTGGTIPPIASHVTPPPPPSKVPKVKCSIVRNEPLFDVPDLPTAEQPRPPPPRNDCTNRFWAMVDTYCQEMTADDIKALEDLIASHNDDPDIYKTQALGKHYTLRWAQEDFMDEQKESNKLGDNSTNGNSKKKGNTNGGRKKTPVAKLFKDVPSDSKVAKGKCVFCSTVLSKNGSRMVKHIEKGQKCDKKVKVKYLMKDKGQETVPTDSKTEKKSQRIDSDSESGRELQFLLDELSATSTAIHSVQRTLDSSFFTSSSTVPCSRPDSYSNRHNKQIWICLFKKSQKLTALLTQHQLQLPQGQQQTLRLPVKTRESLLISPILKSEENAFRKIIPERKKFLVKSIHLEANLVDPRYCGSHLSGEEAVDAMQEIYDMATQLRDMDATQIVAELADYRCDAVYCNVLCLKQYTYKVDVQYCASADVPDKLLREVDLNHSGSSADDTAPLGPLAQRLLAGLVDDRSVSENCENKVGLGVGRPGFLRSLGLGSGAGLEKRLRRELQEHGLIDPDHTNQDDDDEILQELKRCQAELRAVSAHNRTQLNRLLKLAREALYRHDLKKKLRDAEAKVIEAYKNIASLRVKKKPPSKRDKEAAWKAIKEREVIVRQLDTLSSS